MITKQEYSLQCGMNTYGYGLRIPTTFIGMLLDRIIPFTFVLITMLTRWLVKKNIVSDKIFIDIEKIIERLRK